ncbi:hypothetical protein C5167_025105 [Papaver somniferum]|uniref:Uncharacterized protein n=1 Tax=Papaver somniferum TaxID=3469 RepID=A0A4Y7JTH1_PAPSO|nr:hypothetical protein C5167_025105 [Papaver somniferum]
MTFREKEEHKSCVKCSRSSSIEKWDFPTYSPLIRTWAVEYWLVLLSSGNQDGYMMHVCLGQLWPHNEQPPLDCIKLTDRALLARRNSTRAGLASVAPNGTSQGPLPSSSYVTQTHVPWNPPLNDVWESRTAW